MGSTYAPHLVLVHTVCDTNSCVMSFIISWRDDGMSLCTLHGMPVWHVYCEGREMVYFHTNGNLCGNNLLLVIIIILF